MSQTTKRATVEELHAAYVAASGYNVSLNRQRGEYLREIWLMPHGFAVEDVRAVIAGIRAHIAKGTPRYTERSLLFSNAMKPESFEERALLCREAKARREAKAKRAAQAPVVAAPETVLPNVPMEQFKGGMEELRRKLSGGGGR